MSDPKETGFFRDHFERGTAWYSKHWEACDENACKGEFTSYYLYDTRSLQRLYDFVPNAKILVIIRDPIERSRSQVLHGIRAGVLSVPIKCRIDMSDFLKIINDYPIVISRSLYFDGLRFIEKNFGRNSMFVLDQADIRSRPRVCLQELWKFLGVDEEFVPSRAEKIVSKGIYPRSKILELLRRKVYLLFRETHGVIPLIRKSRFPELYRSLNQRKDAVTFSPEVVSYIKQQVADDWQSSLAYVSMPSENR